MYYKRSGDSLSVLAHDGDVTETFSFHIGCQGVEAADIYFLVDGSSSLDYLDFVDMKNFLKEMIKLFDIGMSKVRLGLVQFSHFNELEFELDKYTSASDLIKGIENIRQISGNTSTGGALAYMKPLFEKARRQRGVTVPCHLVVLTDGQSQDSVREPAMKLREDQINIYAVGVREANVTQLYEIAGVKKRVYFVHDFDLLNDIKYEVTREICTTEGKTMLSLCPDSTENNQIPFDLIKKLFH